MPLFNFQDPDEVGQSEYRAVYECLQDGLEDFDADPQEYEPHTREDHAETMLHEIIRSAFAMLKKLGKQPQLKVEYFGNIEPNLTCPDGMMGLFNTIYIDGDAGDLHVLTYKGVSIYQTVKDGGDMTSDCWYATLPRCSSDSDDAFDVRDLPSPDDSYPFFQFKPEGVDHENEEHMALAWAIFLANLHDDGYEQRWRLLGTDETVQQGDQRLEGEDWKEVSILSIGELADTNHLYRRKA